MDTTSYLKNNIITLRKVAHELAGVALMPLTNSNKKNNLDIISNPFFQHALASPLTCLNLSIDSTKKYLNNNQHQEAISYLQIAQTATQQITHLFSLTKPDSNLATPFDVSRAIREVVSLLNVEFPEASIQLSFALAPVKIAINRFLFQEVIVCLIRNAVESYDSNTSKPIVKIIVKRRASTLEITMIDGGCGMSWVAQLVATHQRFSTKKTGKGIGLSFVKAYVSKTLNGTLKIRSKTGIGTTVIISIPLKGATSLAN